MPVLKRVARLLALGVHFACNPVFEKQSVFVRFFVRDPNAESGEYMSFISQQHSSVNLSCVDPLAARRVPHANNAAQASEMRRLDDPLVDPLRLVKPSQTTFNIHLVTGSMRRTCTARHNAA